MKLVDVECSFEGNKIIFFFTADGRVDFRELVKDLAGVFHARIELRQIGVRDEAKMLGGLGICGQPFCCKRFLEDFQPVSIKMAKTQNLSLNPAKISGSCGRLMCCLKYEQHAYEDAQTRMPKNDSFVQTPDGPGNISAVNLVRETVTVRLDDAPEAPKTYQVDEIIVLRSGKGGREGIDIPPRPARIEKKAALDEFGMEIVEREPFVRQFRNSPSVRRETAERSESKEGKGSKENRREPGLRPEMPEKRRAAAKKRLPPVPSGRSRPPRRRGAAKRSRTRRLSRCLRPSPARPARCASVPVCPLRAMPPCPPARSRSKREPFRRRSRQGGRRGRGSGGDFAGQKKTEAPFPAGRVRHTENRKGSAERICVRRPFRSGLLRWFRRNGEERRTEAAPSVPGGLFAVGVEKDALNVVQGLDQRGVARLIGHEAVSEPSQEYSMRRELDQSWISGSMGRKLSSRFSQERYRSSTCCTMARYCSWER